MVVDIIAQFFLCCGAIISIYYAVHKGGLNFFNIPLLNAVGMVLIYFLYALSGIQFNSGRSWSADTYFVLVLFLMIEAFAFGKKIAFRPPCVDIEIRSETAAISPIFVSFSVILFLFFVMILTRGDPLRIIYDGVALKWERLQMLDPFIFNLEGVVLAVLLIGFSWAIIGYSDKCSPLPLFIYITVSILYILSTGSRSPIILILGAIIPSVFLSSLSNPIREIYRRNSQIIIPIAIVFVAFPFVLVTEKRKDFESFDADVFVRFFGIEDSGVLSLLSEDPNSVSISAITLVTYGASTYNHYVIRFKECGELKETGAYNLFYFFYKGMEYVSPELSRSNGEYAQSNRDNKLLLNKYCSSADQWSMPLGPPIWEFGPFYCLVFIYAFYFLSGYWLERWMHGGDSGQKIFISIMVCGIGFNPLTSPLTSIYLFYCVFILITMRFLKMI